MAGLKHIAFIMDGNGRWAQERGKPRTDGHKMGARALERAVSHGFALGADVLSFYAFSTENWSRPKAEVDAILSLLIRCLTKNAKKLVSKKIRLVVSGDLTRLSFADQSKVQRVIEETKDFSKTLNIAFNYGGRNEIIRAVNKAVALGKEVDEAAFEDLLYTKGLPPVDLLIRTSGEQRLSNFLLWQSAYSELYFTPTYWPDFDEDELDKAVSWYYGRNRRFGNI